MLEYKEVDMKHSDNIFGFTKRRCEVSDKSRKRKLTPSHSPSVIRSLQAIIFDMNGAFNYNIMEDVTTDIL